MAFRWLADDGPLVVVFESSLTPSTKKKLSSWTPTDKTFWIHSCWLLHETFILPTNIDPDEMLHCMLANDCLISLNQTYDIY